MTNGGRCVCVCVCVGGGGSLPADSIRNRSVRIVSCSDSAG